ncbi:EexN family lipoprotein [Desulfovibrio sp. OttesenSCG-928-C14]|nr:EexN family lipoprotein [Desulfovibrio sp. OttesenSCG-928-C14]
MKLQNVLLAAVMLAVAVTATGCKEEKKAEVHTVEWFLAPENKAVLDETLKQCNNNPGMLKDDPNCINAANARHKLFFHLHLSGRKI